MIDFRHNNYADLDACVCVCVSNPEIILYNLCITCSFYHSPMSQFKTRASSETKRCACAKED